MKFVFTGDLNCLAREEAERIVESQGGRSVSSVSKLTDYVIAGDEELAKYKREGSATTKLDKAYDLAADGKKVKILTEAEFIALIK